jgi:Holliday junction resolvase RusA-like endonuclease
VSVRISTRELEKLGVNPTKPKPKAKRKSRKDHLARMLATPPRPEQTAEEAAQQRNLFERHDAVTYSLRLPLAPSVDHYYQTKVLPGWKHALVHLSSEGQAYVDAVDAAWRAHFKGWPPDPLTGRLRLLIVWHFAREGKQDGSNRLKALEDALTKCGAYLDDSQIDDEHWLRGSVIPGTGAADITIETIRED